jgi:hypothetical protein
MITIKLFEKVGSFAENKDIAREIRRKEIMPALKKGQKVILDFNKITGANQSFIHALVSDLIRKYGSEVLNEISFKSCNEITKKVITIVTEYMQESV